MRGPSTGAQNCREHAGATLAVKPRAGTMQHTALPTMHRPLSHTGTHTHPRSRREPGPRPGPRATGRRPLQPPAYLEVAPAAVPPWRPRWAGARPRAAAASDSGQVSAGAEQRLRAGSGRRLHPRSAPGRRLPHRTHQLFIARLQLPRRSQSQAEAPLMGPPPPKRQPAARPGASDSPPGTGMGRGRAGGGGARGAPAKLPTACALRRAPGPRRRDHPPCVRPRGAPGLGGRSGAPRRGEGEGRKEERGRKMKG